MRLLLLLSTIVLSCIACTHELRIPVPALPPGQPLPEPPTSTLDIPITLDLASAEDILEREVPTDISAMGSWTMVANDRIGIKYHLHRGPFAVTVRGDTIDASVTVEYEIEACVREKIPLSKSAVCPKVASCGHGEPMRQVVLSVASKVSWSTDWHLVSATTTSLSYPNRCKVTFLDYDVTPHLDSILKQRLGDAARKLDAEVASVSNIAGRAEMLWNAGWKPLALHAPNLPPTWLLVRPQHVRVAPFDGDGLAIATSVGLDARPALWVGTEPPAVDVPALPALEIAAPTSGFYVATRLELPYAEATEQSKRVVGTVLDLAGRKVETTSLEVIGSNNVAIIKVGVRIKTGFLESTTSVLYLTGIPQYDQTTSTLTATQLDYSIETRRTLESVDWLLHSELLDIVRAKATWRLHSTLAQARERLQQALNTPLGARARLTTELADIRPVGILTTATSFALYAEARGTSALSITP